MNKIKVAILGYGNLGKGVESCLNTTGDMELTGIFTRRNPEEINPVFKTPVFKMEDLQNFKDKIDVVIICGGSAKDLPKQSPFVLSMFNCVDSFDNHLKITEHFEALDKIGKVSKKLIALSVGWDPGLFSIAKLLFSAIMPGKTYVFWGEGVSQGHSEALRTVEGVKYAVQYTIPKKEALDKVRKGLGPELSTFDKHLRECFVVPEKGANLAEIEQKIKNMPNYYKGYDTVIHFINEEEFKANHTKMPHGGTVMHSADFNNNKFFMELSIKLGSNPEFTAAILVAYARAVYKLNKEGKCGAVTVLDIPIKYLSEKTGLELYREYL